MDYDLCLACKNKLIKKQNIMCGIMHCLTPKLKFLKSIKNKFEDS